MTGRNPRPAHVLLAHTERLFMAKSRPGTLSGNAAKQASIWRRPKVLAVTAACVAGVVGLGGLAFALTASNSDETPTASASASPGDAWYDETLRTFGPMAQGLITYLGTINDWSAGDARAAEVKLAATVALPNFIDVRTQLAEQTPFEAAPRALDNYRDSVELYIQTARLATAGADLESEELTEQVQLGINRLRLLADRVYDQSEVEMAPHRASGPDLSGIDFRRPAEVPDFREGEGDYAPGPPLTERAANTPPRQFQDTRPEQDLDDWLADVEKASIPSAQAQADAIADGDLDSLGELADQLTAASDSLYEAPDPAGERVVSTRTQLGLLVQAEAMRVAQMATLAEGAQAEELTTIAETLALVGNQMMDPRLGARDGGFDAALRSREL